MQFWAVLFCSGALASSAGALELFSVSDDVEPAHRSVLLQVSQQVEAKLPPLMVQQLRALSHLKNGISLESKKLDDPTTGARAIVGFWDFKSTSHRIGIDPRAPLEKLPAALIREVAWIYDFAGVESPLLIRGLSLTNDTQVVELLDWGSGDLSRAELSRQKERIKNRLVDPAETLDQTEAFGINLARFLLDSEYSCRRPAFARFLRNQFKFTPQFGTPCTPNWEVPTWSAFDRMELRTLDPKRIYQVHYLFAAPGSSVVSGWGHAMLRFVVCKPGRALGPGCLRDVTEHVVLSFVAGVAERQMSMWQGLFGGYPSVAFLQTWASAEQVYTIDEGRALKSLPIRLTEEEQNFFIEKSLEKFWSYRGTYRFLSQNCASETMRVFRSAVGRSTGRSEDLPTVSTPSGLWDALDSAGLAAIPAKRFDNGFTDRDLREKGFYTPEVPARMEPIYERIKALVWAIDDGHPDYATWTEKYEPEDRRDIFLQVEDPSPVVRAGFAAIEAYLLRKERSRIKDLINQAVLKAVEEKPDLASHLNPWLEHALYPTQNSFRDLPGYGIPLAQDARPESYVDLHMQPLQEGAVGQTINDPKFTEKVKVDFKDHLAYLDILQANVDLFDGREAKTEK